jgi:hypothetical protein
LSRQAAAYWMPRLKQGMTAVIYGEAFLRNAYAFFFTSLTLEKVMPSARSLV